MSFEELFTGKHNLILIAGCPMTFRQDNPWSKYIRMMLCKDDYNYDMSNWQWKSKIRQTQKEQYSFLQGFLRSKDIQYTDKMAVGGWILSEMLEKVPIYTKHST